MGWSIRCLIAAKMKGDRLDLPILYRDRELVVINKPSGLFVHRTALDRSATKFALQTLRDQIGETVYPVHRLDRATSGALIFALSKESAHKMMLQFSSSEVQKTYLAVVRGGPVLKQRVYHPLLEILDMKTDRRAQKNKSPQEAITDFETLATHEFPVQVDKYPTSRYSLVRARPLTGRKHQIRRHLHHLGHPIVGDTTYGKSKHNHFFESTFKVKRLFLACTELSFRHPISGEPVCVHAPLEQDYLEVVRALQWEDFLVT